MTRDARSMNLFAVQEGLVRMPTKEKETSDLGRAKELLESIRTRCTESDTTVTDMHAFTVALGIVLDKVMELESKDKIGRSDDSCTAMTVPETVATSEYSQRFTEVSRLDDSFVDACRYDEDQWQYQDMRRTSHRKQDVDYRSDTDDDYLVDELEFSQGLHGYEDGFWPRRCDTIEEKSIGSIRSERLDSLKSGRTKAEHSVGEESSCFYCQHHGDGEKCTGSKFCV